MRNIADYVQELTPSSDSPGYVHFGRARREYVRKGVLTISDLRLRYSTLTPSGRFVAHIIFMSTRLRSAVTLLITALDSRYSILRGSALAALSQIGGRRATVELIARLQSGTPGQRRESLSALTCMFDNPPSQSLLELYMDISVDARRSPLERAMAIDGVSLAGHMNVSPKGFRQKVGRLSDTWLSSHSNIVLLAGIRAVEELKILTAVPKLQRMESTDSKHTREVRVQARRVIEQLQNQR